MRRSDREIQEDILIEEIIHKADVCRVALANENTPYIVTMNFGYNQSPKQQLFFHCASEGRKLDMIRKNKYVCFEMDTDHAIYGGEKGCDWGMKFSSVVGYGNIEIITEREAKIQGLNCIMAHYGSNKEYTYDEKVLARTVILRLDIKEMCGKRK
jgi:uncharacterized protein